MSKNVFFVVDPALSRMAFRARSNVHPIEGEGGGIEGTVEVSLVNGQPDLSKPVAGHLTLEVAHLETGNVAYDTEIRRRLQWRAHPLIEGTVTSVDLAGGTYRVVGDLSLHGLTRSVTVDIVVRIEGGRLEASWRQTIDIRDFGLRPPRVLMLRVEPEVEVTVDLVATAEATGGASG